MPATSGTGVVRKVKDTKQRQRIAKDKSGPWRTWVAVKICNRSNERQPYLLKFTEGMLVVFSAPISFTTFCVFHCSGRVAARVIFGEQGEDVLEASSRSTISW